LPLGDIKNIAFMGTVVTKGRGKGIAIATGRKTEIGKISKRLARTKIRRTPLQKKLAILGVVLVILSFLLCGAVSGIGILRGIGWETMLRIGVSLAVSVIPEGLILNHNSIKNDRSRCCYNCHYGFGCKQNGKA